MKRVRPFFLLTVVITSSVIGSCKPAVVEMCDEKLPKLSEEVERALSLLNPRVRPYLEEGRRLASPVSAIELSAKERREWKKWSEKLLNQSQHDLDELETEPSLLPLKKEFSKAAMLWVAFHVHAERGNLKKMVETLNRIREHMLRGRQACSK